MNKPTVGLAITLAATLTISAAPFDGAPGSSASGDSQLAAAAARLESAMDDHLFHGQVVSSVFGDDSRTPGDVVGLYQVSDSALWTGVYLAGQAARYETARATTDTAESAAALARIREVAAGLHRNITISRNWIPASECGGDDLPTLPSVPDGGSPRRSCGVTVDGVTTGESGRLFRACFPEGDPMQAQGDDRPAMIFGPIPWEDGQNWYCEDGTSRDQYAGVTFGLTAALDAVNGVPGLEDLTRQIAGDLMAMTGYLVRHGWSVVYPHTRVSTRGSENFVFPLFVQVPTARLNMAVTARHAAHVAGSLDQQAFFDAVWDEEWAHFGHGQVGENLLAIQSPHQSYYVMNLQHLTGYDIARYAPDAATREAQKGYFAIIDETTRDDVNAHFETLTYGMTGERWRHDLAVEHLHEWLVYRDRQDDGVAYASSDRCGSDIACVPEDEVNWYQDTPSGPQRVATEPGSSETQRALAPLPIADRPGHEDFLWQRSPYQLRDSEPGFPRGREPGVDFLTPYWMLRFFEQVAPPAVTGMPDWAGPHTETRSPDWSGPNVSASAEPAPVPGEGPVRHLIGSMHEHSSYSDGWFDTRPEDFYRSGKAYGLDFMGGADHSDTLGVPVSVSEGCIEGTDVGIGQDLPTNLVRCVPGDPDQPTDGLTKWEATKRQATNVTDATFSAVTGFEWTSDRFEHMNVYFSTNQTGAKVDGGYLDMDTFYDWFTRSPELGGGADGIATFNHPGTKSINQGPAQIDGDETRNWNDFEYHPEADARMVGIEVFNDDDEYGTRTNSLAPNGFYAHALDRGWHVGAIGAEDLGHKWDDAYGDDDNNWGGPVWAKTVVIADQNTPAAIRAAMLQRRFYAVGPYENDLRLDFTVDGAPMGSRLTRPEGAAVLLEGRVNHPEGLTLELVTNGGEVVATAAGSDLSLAVPVAAGETWYHLRVRRSGTPVAYSSPVWVNATTAAVGGEWLAGDLHVHTCYSHDGYCGPADDNADGVVIEPNPDHPEDSRLDSDVYTLSGDIDERFTEASVRGLDYLAITDHNDVRSSSDPDFGSHGVIGVAGYENSLSGHAQMLGARRIYDRGSGVEGINAMADTVRADGGVFQINHPADGVAPRLDGCQPEDLAGYDWGYGMRVVPDTIEVWNVSHLLQPPMPANSNNDNAEAFWECFLDAGYRIGATGGSDSHWLSTSAVQGVGNPTTWVFAPNRSEAGILQALREGRTSVSSLPRTEGGAPLLLEADSDGDGLFESMIGDTVAPGATMRVRSDSPSATGRVVVRANGETILEDTLTAGGAITFTGPDTGWVRAKLVDVEMPDAAGALCDPLDDQSIPFADEPLATTYCDNQLLVNGLTSPIYVEAVPTTLTVSVPATVHTTEALTACALLTSTEGALEGRQVTLTLGAAEVSATTSADGIACADLAVDRDPGPATATAVFDGDDRYAPSLGTATTEVVAEPTMLDFVSTGWRGASVDVTVRLAEHDGVPLAGQTVTITTGEVTTTVATDAAGEASTTMQVRGSGAEVTVTATFAGTARLEPASASRTLDRGR